MALTCPTCYAGRSYSLLSPSSLRSSHSVVRHPLCRPLPVRYFCCSCCCSSSRCWPGPLRIESTDNYGPRTSEKPRWERGIGKLLPHFRVDVPRSSLSRKMALGQGVHDRWPVTASRTSPKCACTKSNVSRAVGTQPFGTNDKVRGDQREWSMN